MNDDQLIQFERQKTYIHREAHSASLDMVKEIIEESTNEIKVSFEKTLTLLSQINELSDLDKIKELADVASSNLHEYIRVLQCEDRAVQIINGTQDVMKNENKLYRNKGYTIPLKSIAVDSLMPFYTIQSQRDFILDIDKNKNNTSGEITLF